LAAEEKLAVLEQNAPRRVSRRELAHTLLSSLAAGMITPPFSPLHPIHKHLLNEVLLDSADKALAAGSYKPGFLSATQFAAVDKLSEAIVPGSHKAQSAEFIDLILSVDSPKHQEAFAASLSGLEAAATKTFNKGIASLSRSEMQQLLQAASASESPELEHFENLKEWSAGAYYSSEIGMRELGWTPDRVFPSYPACTHEESHT
jgi:hypothetical protein